MADPKTATSANKTNQNNERGSAIIPNRAFVVVFGGPGLFWRSDPEHHDKSWSSFLNPFLSRNKKGSVVDAAPDELVYWLVYRPAYEARWTDDASAGFLRRFLRDAVEKVRKEGFKNYVDKIEARAKERDVTVCWIKSESEFWSQLASIGGVTPISRVWYFGHAAHPDFDYGGLWLSLDHDGRSSHALNVDYGGAVSPEKKAIILAADISGHLDLKPITVAVAGRPCRFFGCNTLTFAKTWTGAFGMECEAAEGKVVFAGSMRVVLASDAMWVALSRLGAEVVIASSEGAVVY